MATAFTIASAITTVLFVILGAWTLREANKVREPRFAQLLKHIAYAAILLASVGLFFLLMGLAHMNIPVTSASRRAFIFGFVVMGLADWLGIRSTRVVQAVAEPMRKAERMMNVLSDQLPATPVSDLGLTARELEVVSVIASGSITDAQIAEKLFISKATAATHVRNVLKKADLNNRRDLMLLGGWREVAPSERPVRHTS